MQFLPRGLLSVVLLGAALFTAPGTADAAESRVLTLSDGTELRYGIHLPDSLDGPVPLIIGLHYGWGGGGRPPAYYGRGYLDQLAGPGLADTGAIIIAPDCPGRGWGDPVSDAAVMQLVAAIRAEFDIDADRIAVTGFSLGGMGTWSFAAQHPDLIAAAIPVAGHPGDFAAAWGTTPIYAIHGERDTVMPIAPTRAAIAELAARGVMTELAEVDLTHSETSRYQPALRRAGAWLEQVWSPAAYLYVWTGDPDADDSDFLAVIDAAPGSAGYGEILSTVAVGRSGGAHHSEHVMPEGDELVVNGFMGGQSWVINVADPLNPVVAATFEGAGPYTKPHSFERAPNGNILSTFQNMNGDTTLAGGLVELDPMGNFVRGSDAADSADPELHPYSLAINPEMDRVVTTTTDMHMAHTGRSVQIWSLSKLELLHTLPLPPGPLGNENEHPAEPRFLPDGSAIVNTFNCGLYHLTGIDGDKPAARFIGSVPRPLDGVPGMAECSLPVIHGNFWVQTSDPTHSMIVYDISDPTTPSIVDELVFGGDNMPHWLSLEPGGNRIVMTGAGADLDGMVVLLEIDPVTGQLRVIEGFGRDGDLGVSMRGGSWPHGNSGPAIPHGAVFSR